MSYQDSSIVALYNGQRDSLNAAGDPPGGLPERTNYEYVTQGHSLDDHGYAGEGATPTPFTKVNAWMARFADADGTTIAGGRVSLGQIELHISAYPPTQQNWDNGGQFATNAWESGTYAEQNFDVITLMPSNYYESEMAPRPYVNDTASALSRIGPLIDLHRADHPTADIFVRCHWPYTDAYDGGAFPMVPATFATYDAETQNEWLTWFIAFRNAISGSGRPVAMIPDGPVTAWCFRNLAYLSGITFLDRYGDSAPHGNEPTYFMAALSQYICHTRRTPDLTNLDFTGTSQMPQAMIDNRQDIANNVRTRLDFHNQTFPVYVPS